MRETIDIRKAQCLTRFQLTLLTHTLARKPKNLFFRAIDEVLNL